MNYKRQKKKRRFLLRKIQPTGKHHFNKVHVQIYEYLYLAELAELAEPGCHGDRTRLLSSATKMASSSEPLTVDNIRKIWKTEFLPNIKKEIRNELKTEIEKVNCLITNLSKRLNSSESSQQLISDKYDSVLKSMQSTKKQINDLNNWCEAQDNKINHLNGSVYDAEAAIDCIQAGHFNSPPTAQY